MIQPIASATMASYVPRSVTGQKSLVFCKARATKVILTVCSRMYILLYSKTLGLIEHPAPRRPGTATARKTDSLPDTVLPSTT
jgi:hypothetical protein